MVQVPGLSTRGQWCANHNEDAAEANANDEAYARGDVECKWEMVVGPAGPGQLERHPSTEWESNVLTGAGAGNLSSRTSGPGVSG